jgi:hypothetical protein
MIIHCRNRLRLKQIKKDFIEALLQRTTAGQASELRICNPETILQFFVMFEVKKFWPVPNTAIAV